MARERLGDLRARLDAEADFEKAMGKKLLPKKKRRPAVSAKGWADALASVDERLQTSDWEGATPAEWVALYARLHAKVYGAECLELDNPKTRAVASIMAKRLRATIGPGGYYFPDDADFADYVRWAWLREKVREEWRRQNNGGNGGRLHWRNLFGVAVLGDYQLNRVRKAGRR